ncbi:methyltransferase [Metabacillus malikii]|uniref:SAM-dependent methyltransferase n=1 Tax=Metabacillus malikii TaxID=1504265 RepID=A0ABT9ZEI1_9BACI|nr:methyltransferase [Metabacillus malikii]MDQ0230344.1 SAM-dependent methyltransferase [Metabacillus malikii]
MTDYYYDKLLHIKTTGIQKGRTKSFHYHPYEATPYQALEELCKHYEIKKRERIVDFGCGKGRLNFYMHYYYQATVTGIEMNEQFYLEALANMERYVKESQNGELTFLCCLAEEYEIHPKDNCFYFFNPFSSQIFMKVIKRILQSVEQYEREVDVILYYPSKEYIYFLEHYTAFNLIREIPIPEVFERNPNERFLIYQLKFG